MSRVTIAAAALLAVAVPVALLWSAAANLAGGVPRGLTIAAPALPADQGVARRLFLDPIDPADAPEAEDAPKLIGIAGRLPDQAIAMVRMGDGRSKVLAPGESHDGWTLTSLSPDAALFTRGKRRVRSFLAPVEPEPEVGEAVEAGQ